MKILSYFATLFLVGSTSDYFLLFPVFVILLLPVYVLRFVASQARKVLRPDLHKLVNTRSSILSCEEFDTKPGWNLVVWLTQEGVLDLETFRGDFLQEHINAKKENGQLRFPEYQQHYATWWGFQFWKWDKQFDIKNHIRIYDGEFKDCSVIDDEILLQIIKELTWKPWSNKQSPWEFLQIQNYRTCIDYSSAGDTKSILIFRIHHGLGDGYFILKLLMADISGINLQEALGKPQYIRRNICHRIILAALFWIRIPYEFVEMLTMVKDRNPFHVPLDTMRRPMNAALTPNIKLEHIKKIKNLHKVSFTAVITAAIAGGIRKMLIQKNEDVPDEMHVAVAVPMPNHPEKLRNHFIFSLVSLPVGLEDPSQRLKKSNQNILRLKKSTTPITNFALVPLFGAMFRWMMKYFIQNRMSTCLMSNFPGTPLVPTFKGVRVLDMMFSAGLGEGNVGLGFTLISHTDHIRLLSTSDPNILLSDAEVGQLNENILQELVTFKDLQI